MPNMVKFLILEANPETEPEIEAREGSAPVTLRLQREGALEPDPTAITFTNRLQLERTFELAGLAPCLLDPAQLDTFWSVTDEQLTQLSHPITSV
jgi:hypothetical protein